MSRTKKFFASLVGKNIHVNRHYVDALGNECLDLQSDGCLMMCKIERCMSITTNVTMWPPKDIALQDPIVEQWDPETNDFVMTGIPSPAIMCEDSIFSFVCEGRIRDLPLTVCARVD